MKEKCPDLLWVFALPANSTVGVERMLERQYSISTVPALVVNEETVLAGLKSKKELSAHFPELAGCE